jgi:hypothetical protein
MNYTLAIANFASGNYGKSLTCLSAVNAKWDFIKFSIKRLVIQNYYELKYPEELMLQVDSFRHLLKNADKISHAEKNSYMLFIKYITILNKLQINPDELSAGKLKRELIKEPYFQRKDWLLEKINEIK